MLDIHTKVQNFDFAHIVTFLNKLDQHELDVLASNTSTQLMQIHIVYGIPERNRLTRWINRKKATTKKGSNIDFNYHPAVPAHEYYWEEQQRKARRMDMIALAKEVLKEKPDDQHYQQEGRRILQALEQG
ncbi:hypothetical protein CLAFUW4_00199 [Fulvia fulva]|uniref:Uncharacterized protein n=1 Tax=Passalora fulva TaxID=5499 RepID=A0A9Q8L875_PASFU|nr:uncharacterized protein CLAFUR5_00198 [Fulvia fulva]KAK4634455.1 hypothetical protein CLAFUR4_00199 [Fulvia fulva]KAK4637040.1 hypothetical protein CLAFUR0_00199 [Fulvia fulva]UJO11963.1 hypothetical protein CLAFUR5_00198 [Fulvia fulva]WPV08319.1 hypothetical protein CLAFUW4_00199 [Fulvia fulva]WPV24843.1 hypothetical protein CLAFUW7_00201 [Fulvia fulva]